MVPSKLWAWTTCTPVPGKSGGVDISDEKHENLVKGSGVNTGQWISQVNYKAVPRGQDKDKPRFEEVALSVHIIPGVTRTLLTGEGELGNNDLGTVTRPPLTPCMS